MSVDPDLLQTGSEDREILVLHVDDDPGQTDLAKTYLERASDRIIVRTCNSVEAGLDTLETDPIDCVVSDYQMPRSDGLEFLETVRADFPDLPFVLFTGHGSEEIASRAISAGVTEYLQKETGTEQYSVLANRIEHLVSGHQSSRALSRVKDLFTRVFDARTEALVLIDREREEVLAANEQVQTVLGHRPAALVEGAGLEDHLSDADPCREFLETVLEEGQGRKELAWRTADGDHVHVEAIATTLDADELEAVVVSFRDVTDRKERERDLEAMRAAVEHAGHSIYRTDPDGTITYVNPAFERITGYDREEVLGETPSILQSGVHGEEFYANLWKTINSGDVWRSRVVNERADGERYVVDQTIAPVGADEIREYVSINAEVGTFRDRPKGARARGEARELLDTSPVPMLLAEAETGIVREANQPAADLFERPREELEALHQAELHPDERAYRELFREHKSQASTNEDGRATRVELPDGSPIEIVTGSGDRRRVAIAATPITVGGTECFLGAFVDLGGLLQRGTPA